MARHVATKLRIEFAERQAIQLLSGWLNESVPVTEGDYFDTDPYSADLEIAADYLRACPVQAYFSFL